MSRSTVARRTTMSRRTAARRAARANLTRPTRLLEEAAARRLLRSTTRPRAPRARRPRSARAGGADAGHGGELAARRRRALGDLCQRPVVEDDVRRDPVVFRALQPPFAQRRERRRQGLGVDASPLACMCHVDAELREEPAGLRFGAPAQREVTLRPCDAYVEQSALLCHGVLGLRLPHGSLALRYPEGRRPRTRAPSPGGT